MTDSKSCVQAYQKLYRVEFSASPPRVYLSVYREPLPGRCVCRGDTAFRFHQRVVQEFEKKLLRHDPLEGLVSLLILAVATANLNARIRSRGLSSRKMWTQRDQFSNQQIPLHDQSIVVKHISVGNLVYLFSVGNKTRARDRYLVVEVSDSFCSIRKFVRSQLRSTSYRMKTSDCCKVPYEVSDFRPSAVNSDTDSSSDEALLA